MSKGGLDFEAELNRITQALAEGKTSIDQLPRPGGGAEKTGANFKDLKICDNAGCSNKAKEVCGKCKCRYYCCRDCQVEAWSQDQHKPECKWLKTCRQTSQITKDMSEMQDDVAVTMAVTTTKSHGTHFYIMEHYKRYGPESNRSVPLASTTDLSLNGITQCIINSILYPEFDCDSAGRRRPYYVDILKDTFPDNMKNLVDDIATLLVRLGIKIHSFDDFAEMDSWGSNWFFVQQGWQDELYDELFLKMIEKERRRPLKPDGMARKELGKVVGKKQVPRLDPKDFPTRDDAMKLKYSKTQLELRVVSKGTDLYIISFRNGYGKIEMRQDVQLRTRTGRPYPEDVMLCIYKCIVENVKERPVNFFVAQPSVCVLAEVKVYEKALDKSISKRQMMLAQVGSLEQSLEHMISMPPGFVIGEP